MCVRYPALGLAYCTIHIFAVPDHMEFINLMASWLRIRNLVTQPQEE